MEIENLLNALYRYFKNFYLQDIYVWNINRKDNEIVITFADYSKFKFVIDNNKVLFSSGISKSNIYDSLSNVDSIEYFDLCFKNYPFYKKAVPFKIAYYSDLLM